MNIRGRHAKTGMPKMVTLSSHEIEPRASPSRKDDCR